MRCEGETGAFRYLRADGTQGIVPVYMFADRRRPELMSEADRLATGAPTPTRADIEAFHASPWPVAPEGAKAMPKQQQQAKVQGPKIMVEYGDEYDEEDPVWGITPPPKAMKAMKAKAK